MTETTVEPSITVRPDEAWAKMPVLQLMQERELHEQFIRDGGTPGVRESLVRADYQIRLINRALLTRNGLSVA